MSAQHTLAAASAALLPIVGSILAGSARAGELEVGGLSARVELTSTTNAGWHSDGEGHGELFERLNVATATGAWHLAVRLDTATFFSTPPPIESRYTLEKISAGWTGRELEVTAGDSYISFGRGLSLSLRKVDELGVDTTLRGLKVSGRAGDLSGTVALGYANINNVDEASGKSEDDPYDLLGGVLAELAVVEGINAGAYGTFVAFHDALGLVPLEPYTERFVQLGLLVDAPELTPNLGLYLEGMSQLRYGEDGAAGDPGLAAYAAATLYLGPATLLLEGKVYGELAPIQPNLDAPELASIAYNNPPTVERVLQSLENPQRDIAGGRARFDWSSSPEVLAYVSYGAFRDAQGYADPDDPGTTRPGIIHDPYAGLEARWDDARSWAIVAAGWRGVLLDGAAVREDIHVEADVSQALGQRVSATVHLLHEEKSKVASQILDERHREGTLLLGLRLNPYGAIAGGYDYTTDPTQPKRDYFFGTLQWDVTSSSSVRLFAGSSRGGLKCVSGVCRTFPPFEGAKLTVTVRL